MTYIFLHYIYLECIRYRSGLHRLHRSCAVDAWLSGVGAALLHHVVQLGALLHVWEHGGGPRPSEGPQHDAQVDGN